VPKILLFSTLREKLGIKELQLEVEGTVLDILREMEKIGYPVGDLVLKDGKVKRGFIILVNGKNIVHLEGLSTRVGVADKVAIFPPAGGG